MTRGTITTRLEVADQAEIELAGDLLTELRRLAPIIPDLLATDELEGIAAGRARFLTAGLFASDRLSAQQTAHDIVRILWGTGQIDPKWWNTWLGQAVYAAGGMPAGPVPYPVAAAVLGVSRTRVAELVVGNRRRWNAGEKLVLGEIRATVTPGSLRMRWEQQRGVAYA